MSGSTQDKHIFFPNVDIFELLKDRLVFISNFYDRAVTPFEEQKRLISGNLEPFVDTRNPEECDGPAFEFEWQDADDFEHTLGFLCLNLLNKALENYTRMFLMRENGITKKSELSRYMQNVPKSGGYVMRHLRALENRSHPLFTWMRSPVSKAELEDITETRNVFMHDEQLDERNVRQDPTHFKANAQSSFSDLRWADAYADEEFWNNPQQLVVTRSNLMPAIAKVREFCDFLETCRTVW